MHFRPTLSQLTPQLGVCLFSSLSCTFLFTIALIATAQAGVAQSLYRDVAGCMGLPKLSGSGSHASPPKS